MEDLIEKVKKLESLYHAVLDAAIEEGDVWKAHTHLKEYQQVRQAIRLRLFSSSVMQLPEVSDKKVLAHLQKISSGEDLPNAFLKGLFQDELDLDRIKELSGQLFFSWFDPYDYIEDLYEVGSLVVGAGQLPDHLEELVGELRHCFVFKQYHATCALCRTVLEISVRDIFQQQGLDDPHSENYLFVEQRISKSNRRWFMDDPDPSLAQMIGMLCLLRPFRFLKHQLRDIVGHGNDMIHGYRSVTRDEAEHMLRSTLRAVHDLYEAA
jgi:hypothetical protein